MPIPLLATTQRDFTRRFAAIRDRGVDTAANVEDQVRRIVDSVRRGGDRALLQLTKRLDGTALSPRTLRVSGIELDRSVNQLAPADRRALRLAVRRIAAFHRHQRQVSWSYRDGTGITLGQMLSPLRRVGVYVPGGQAVYPSSVLMNVVPARVAGVGEIIMVTPPRPEGISPAVLAAARIAGVTEVYRIGGAQAVAALTFGTATVPRVDKIVGPGNAWVQAAKKLVYGIVDIDKIAGPSEVLVIADSSAPAAYVAADLLAQAEHGSGDECAVLLTTSRPLAVAVQKQIEDQLRGLPRRAEIARVLRRRSALVLVRNLDEAIQVAEEVGPEHLELMVKNPQRWAPRLRNAGAVFLGPFAPAPLGDYVAGPNHVLPTGGTARFFSPLGVYDFVKRTNLVSATRQGLERLGPTVVRLAELEGYQAHAAAVRCRFSTGKAGGKRTRKKAAKRVGGRNGTSRKA